MIAIRSNFFYTRTVPCELWLFDKSKSGAKPAEHADTVLMLDARAVFRKVTRKVYDFSPEQLQNLTAIFWLYRGQEGRFRELVDGYLSRTVTESAASLKAEPAFTAALKAVLEGVEDTAELQAAAALFKADWEGFIARVQAQAGEGDMATPAMAELHARHDRLEPLAEQSRDLVKQIDQLCKLADKAHRAGNGSRGGRRGKANLVKALEEARREGMWQRTYDRHLERYWELEDAANREFVAFADRLARRRRSID